MPRRVSSASRYQGAVLHGRGAEACGLDAPFACRVDQDTLAAFLIEQTSLYHHREEMRRGKTQRETGRRRLLVPTEAASQLRLGFG